MYRCLCRHFFEEVCRTTNTIAFAKSLRSTKEIGVPTKMPCRLTQRNTSPTVPFLQGSLHKKLWNRKTGRLSRLLLLPSAAMLCYALRWLVGIVPLLYLYEVSYEGLYGDIGSGTAAAILYEQLHKPVLFSSPFPAGKTNIHRLWKVAFFSPPLAQNSPITVLQRL